MGLAAAFVELALCSTGMAIRQAGLYQGRAVCGGTTTTWLRPIGSNRCFTRTELAHAPSSAGAMAGLSLML